jgi:hypothetical protein
MAWEAIERRFDRAAHEWTSGANAPSKNLESVSRVAGFVSRDLGQHAVRRRMKVGPCELRDDPGRNAFVQRAIDQ